MCHHYLILYSSKAVIVSVIVVPFKCTITPPYLLNCYCHDKIYIFMLLIQKIVLAFRLTFSSSAALVVSASSLVRLLVAFAELVLVGVVLGEGASESVSRICRSGMLGRLGNSVGPLGCFGLPN